MEELIIPMLSNNTLNKENCKELAYLDSQQSQNPPVIKRIVSHSVAEQKLTYFQSERLEAFCDAVLSILATIMMISLKFSSSQIANHDLKDLLLEFNPGFLFPIPQFFVQLIFFFSSYRIIVFAWYRHMKIYYIYPMVDNFILWLNIIFLLACSFLPLATTLLVIGAVPTVIAFLLVSTLVIGLVQSIQLVYADWLKSSIPSLTNTEQLDRGIIITQIGYNLFTPILLLIAFGISFVPEFGPSVATFCVYFSLFGGKSLIIFQKKYARLRRHRNLNDTFNLKLKNYDTLVSKSRVEFFTDGVFAIVATIIILDATSEINDKIKDSGYTIEHATDINAIADSIISDSSISIFSYFMCFLIVCLFWHLNHSIFHYIRRITNLMTFINMLSQMFLCLLPFSASILVGYANRPGVGNLSIAITFTCTNLFIIGLLQMLLWLLVRFWTPLSQELKVVADLQMIFRVLLIPLFSLLFIFINAFSSHITSIVTLYLFFACIIPTLILIEFLYFLISVIATKMKARDFV